MNAQTELTQTDDADIAAIAAEARDLSEDKFVGLPLKFVKSKWLKAVDNEKQEISATMPFVVDIRSYKRGWIKWQDRKPVYKLLGRPIDNFVSPVRDRLGDLDQSRWPRNNKNEPVDPWQENFSIVMRDVTTDDLVTWTTTSWFGQKALGALLTAYVRDRKQHPGLSPVVLLLSEDKSTANYGDVSAPVLKLVDWQDFGDDAAPPGSPTLAPPPLPSVQELLPPAQPGKRQTRGIPDMNDEIPF